MRRYERILVGIDRPERDVRMLAYVRDIARLAESKEIYLLHVSQKKDGETAAPAGEIANEGQITPETLSDLAAEHLRGNGTYQYRCEVVRGTPLIEMLRLAHDKDIDLIVIGRHYGRIHEADDEALLARRITRKATCSVLALPEKYQSTKGTILVPVRNSECSANALDTACGIGQIANAMVVALNVYQVHTGYSRVGTTLEEHQALLKTAAEHEHDVLLKRIGSSHAEVQCKCVPDLHGKPVPIILEAVSDLAADMVVIGARGRTGAAGVLLGTVTEQLIRESPVPVLAVKKKGECLGILRALLALAWEE